MEHLQMLLCDHPGLEHFRELVEAAREHRAPSADAVAAIAAASSHLFTDRKARHRLEAFGNELGILRGQGKGRKPDTSAGMYAKKIGAVGYVIQAEERLQLQGVAMRKAKKQAIQDVARQKHVSTRNLQRWTAELRADATQKLENFRALRANKSALDAAR